MSLDTSSYLSEFYSNIRGRPIHWEAYVRSNLVSETDVKRIKAVSADKRIDIVSKDGEAYAKLTLGEDGVLQRASAKNRVDIVQYLLMWTGDLLNDVPGFSKNLLALPRPYEFLLSLLKNTEHPVPLLSSMVLTPLLAAGLAKLPRPDAGTKDALKVFYNYLAGVAGSGDQHLQDLAIQSYVTLLQTSYARTVFWQMRGVTVSPLARIIDTAATGTGGSSGSRSERSTGPSGSANLVQGGVPLQLLYHVLLVIWELTFEEEVSEEINGHYDLVAPITDIIRSSIKEKITRVCLAALVNMATKAQETNLPLILVSGVLSYLQGYSDRLAADADSELKGDLATLIEVLEAFEAEQTTLSSYRLEVMSGHLRWSPPHRNEVFWKKYSHDILDDKEMVRQLARVIGTATDKTVLAVAANDVGVLIREVPYARKRWEDLGVKSRVMELMGDTDAEVRYEALRAVQGFLQSAFST